MTAQQTSQTPDADRPELSSALHLAAGRTAVPPLDLDHLVGRVRRKRRTRAGLVAGLAVAVLAAGGVAVPRLLAAKPDPADHGHHGRQKLTVQQVDAQRMISSLESVLPRGPKLNGIKGTALSNKSAPGVPGTGAYTATAELAYDDGQGPGEISVLVLRWDGPGNTGMPKACNTDDQVEHCHGVTLPDGEVLNLQQLTLGDLRNPTRQWEANLSLPGGGVVALETANVTGTGGVPTRHDPPLTLAQLRAAVLAPVWHPIVAAVPKQLKITMSAPGVNTVLAASIPPGFTRTPVVMGRDITLGMTTVLTDGQGKGSVFADAETDGSPSEALTQFRRVYPTAAKLPDGDWLTTFRKPGRGGAGTVQNWAVLLHGDLRIHVVALNSVDVTGPRTRSEPVLTLDQCAAVVENPQWRDVP